MKILHVIIGLHVGGAELMLRRLVLSSHGNAGFEHAVVSLTTLGPIGEELQASGVKVIALGMGSMADAPALLVRLVRTIRSQRPDIVQTWMYHADLLGGLAARLAGIRKVIWGVRTTDVNAGNSGMTTLVMHLCALLSRVVPSVIVCAADASRRSHINAGYQDTRMIVIPNGFDTERLTATRAGRDAIRSECGVRDNELLIGTMGRFNAAKDHRNFVMAMGWLAERYPTLKFLMVGRGLDSGNAILRSWIEETGYAERFILRGEREDVVSHLSAMDMFCLSSASEGFPNVLGEAMAVGLPCVSTDAGDAAVLLGTTGKIVARKNPTVLAEGIEQLLRLDRADREALGQRAADRIRAEYAIGQTREKFESVYSRYVKGES